MRHFALSVGLAALVGLLLRLFGLTGGSLQLDESYTVILAESPVETIFRLAPTDANPPLTSLAYKLWTAVMGRSELAWELLAVVLGTLSIPLLAVVAGRVFGRRAGVIGAWLLATAPLHVDFCQQVRSYALAIALSMIAAGALLEDGRRPSRAAAGLFLVASWLFLNTHYYAFLILAALLGTALGMSWRDRPRRRRLIILGALLCVLSLPTLYWAVLQYGRFYSFDWIPKPTAGFAVQALLELTSGSAVLAALLSLCAVWGVVQARRDGGQRAFAGAVLGGWLVGPLGLALVASLLGRSFFHPRYVVLWLVPLLMLAALGIARLPRRWHQVGLVAVMAFCALPPILDRVYTHALTGVEEAAYRHIEESYRRGDVVLHLSKKSYVPALYYHDRQLEEYYLRGSSGSNVMTYWMPYETTLGLDELIAYRRAWIYRAPSLEPQAMDFVTNLHDFRVQAPRLVWADSIGTLFLYQLDEGASPPPMVDNSSRPLNDG